MLIPQLLPLDFSCLKSKYSIHWEAKHHRLGEDPAYWNCSNRDKRSSLSGGIEDSWSRLLRDTVCACRVLWGDIPHWGTLCVKAPGPKVTWPIRSEGRPLRKWGCKTGCSLTRRPTFGYTLVRFTLSQLDTWGWPRTPISLLMSDAWINLTSWRWKAASKSLSKL